MFLFPRRLCPFFLSLDSFPLSKYSQLTNRPAKITYTLLYVLPFYLSPTTRPSPTLTRDAPSVIRARIRAVTLACLACTGFTIYLITTQSKISLLEACRLLGFWPIGLPETAKSVLLTLILFAGPLFEKGIVEGGWRDWIRGRALVDTLSSWVGYRNFVIVRLPFPFPTTSHLPTYLPTYLLNLPILTSSRGP